jgi:hypothetical protein
MESQYLLLVKGYQTTGKSGPRPLFPLRSWPSAYNLPDGTVLAKAIAAVDRPVTAGLERDLGACAAGSAGDGEHLARGSVAAARALRLPCLAARRAALGLIDVAFGLEEFLFLGAECKRRIALAAGQSLFLKTHWTTSSLKDWLGFGSSNACEKSVEGVSGKLAIT